MKSATTEKNDVVRHIPFQDLRLTNEKEMTDFIRIATEVLRSGRYVNGPAVSDFERELAAICNTDYCVAVSTGLDALRLILLGYIHLGKLKPGDEVIVPANTFIATFLAVTSCGLTAVAADIADDFCLDFSRLPLTEKTRAVIPVHLYGNVCYNRQEFDRLRSNGILIIEDNAQAIGASILTGGKICPTGSLGDAAAISFYPAKNIGAFGDAGAVITSDENLAKTVRMLANYGSQKKYIHELQGFNCRMDEIQAALLRRKLSSLKEVIDRRQSTAFLYNKLIYNKNFIKPTIFPNQRQVWHQYVVRYIGTSYSRDEIREILKDRGIGTEVHYPVPCHLQPCYSSDKNLKVYNRPLRAEKISQEIISLPIANTTDEEILYIAETLNKI